MSQQMNFDEEQRGYQGTYSPPPTPERGYYQFHEAPGQKLSQAYSGSSPSPGQRLALAIVSVAILVPVIAILLGDASLQFAALIGRLIGLGIVCLAIVIVNIVFNLRR